jgi:hypothetical protein
LITQLMAWMKLVWPLCVTWRVRYKEEFTIGNCSSPYVGKWANVQLGGNWFQGNVTREQSFWGKGNMVYYHQMRRTGKVSHSKLCRFTAERKFPPFKGQFRGSAWLHDEMHVPHGCWPWIFRCLAPLLWSCMSWLQVDCSGRQ